MIKINEIFYSLQGEGTSMGLPCIFIRTSSCPLRCSYCDTKYAYYDGKMMGIDEIIRFIHEFPCKLVEVTGGEPMVQEEVPKLLFELESLGYQTMIETCGAYRLNTLPKATKKIVDFKTPGSGEDSKNCFDLVQDLQSSDEIKFVLCDEKDFDWMLEIIKKFDLLKFNILASPVFGKFDYQTLSSRILASRLPIRFQIQLHKLIWGPEKTGV